EPILGHVQLAIARSFGGIPGEEAAVGDGVELHDRTAHVRLQRHARYTAPGERRDRIGHTRFFGRHDIGARLRMYVTTLHPYRPAVAVQLMHNRHHRLRLRGGYDERAWEGEPSGRRPRHQSVTVAIHAAVGRVHGDGRWRAERDQ